MPTRRFVARLLWVLGAMTPWCGSAQASCTDPSYLKLKPPKYPQEAIQSRAQGTAVLRATVGADGVPLHISVEKSSGDATLDAAAEEAVAAWSFNPSVCDGKATAAAILVPVKFDLADIEAASALANGTSPNAATPSDREISEDDRPIAETTAAGLLRSLREDPDVDPSGKNHLVGAAARMTFFVKRSQRQVWEVLQSDEGWTAAGGGRLSVISTRFVESERATRELYAQRCDGEADWCADVLASYLRRLHDDPPPIPPPAAPSAQRVGGAQR